MTQDHFISLAPVLYLNSMDETLNLYSLLDKLNLLSLLKAHDVFDFRVIDPTSNPASYRLVDTVCNAVPSICKLVFYVVSDKDPSLLDIKDMAFYLQHYPANSSIKSFEHLQQMMRLPDPTFRKFDNGNEANLKIYGTENPPDYEIAKVL